jgi:hypothetical protein
MWSSLDRSVLLQSFGLPFKFNLHFRVADTRNRRESSFDVLNVRLRHLHHNELLCNVCHFAPLWYSMEVDGSLWYARVRVRLLVDGQKRSMTQFTSGVCLTHISFSLSFTSFCCASEQFNKETVSSVFCIQFKVQK